MFLNKRSLSFFLLLTVVISIGLVALPLRRLEAKEHRPTRLASFRARNAVNSEPVMGMERGAGGHISAFVTNQSRANLSVFASLFPQLSSSSLALSNVLAGRIVRVVGTTLQANQNGTVSIELDSQGDENALGFSINFDQTKLTYVSATRGSDSIAAGATMNVNAGSAAIGRIGVALALPAGTPFSAGTCQIVVFTFSVPASGNGSTDISFGDLPIGKEIVDVNAASLTASYPPGTINISPVPSPVPTLSSLNPISAVVGGPGFNLTLNGTGFVSTSVARFNGTDRATTFVSSTQLTAQISATDIQTAGSFPLTVFTPAPGGGTSGAVNLGVGNPAPVVSSLSPVSAVAGGPGFTLTVNGSSFINGSVVQLNGSNRSTTFVNSSQLTAQIAAGDISSTGTAVISVSTPAPGGGSSNSVNFPINTNPAFRIVRVVGATAVAGQNNSVNLELDAQGDENAIGFSLDFDPSKLSYVSAVKGSGAPSATINVNSAFASSGHLGFGLANPALEVFPAGTRQLVVVTFSVPLPVSGATNITFGDFPVIHEIVNSNAAPLTATFSPGTVNINHPAPTMSNISPTAVNTGGPDFTLAVNGSQFVSESIVKVNGSNRPTTFVNSGQLTIPVAAAEIQSAGTLSITVFTPTPGGGTAGPTNLSIDNPLPAVATVSPNNALAGGAGFTLTVNGSSFVNGAVVRWNGSNRTTSFVNGNQLTAQITAADIQAAGSASVTVFNPTPGGGTSGAASFAINNPQPGLSSLSPSSGVVGGASFTLTVQGSSFVNGSVVRWNGSNRTTSFVSSSQLTAQIDASDINAIGSALISVFNPAPGGGISGTLGFDVVNAAPTINNLAPSSGSLNGPDFTLTVNGAQFVSGAVVKVNGSDRATNFVSGAQLTAQIPTADLATAGTFAVTVANPAPGGGSSNSLNFTVNNPTPILSSLSATSAVAGDAAFTLTVNGSDFIGGSVVRFEGSDRATSFVSGSQLTAGITAADLLNAGTFHITVFNPAPGGGTSNTINFSVIGPNPVPAITGLSPASTTAGGAAFALTVNGGNFVDGSVVKVNGSDRTTSFVSSTQLTAQVQAADIASAGGVSISVFNPAPGGGTSNVLDLSVIADNPVPAITSLSPDNALAGDAGFTLTVNGTSFVSGAAVLWNGSSRSTSFVNGNQLTALITAADIQAAGSASVTVFNPAPGGGTSAAASFTINNRLPTIISVAPTSVIVGGPEFTLTVNGGNFSNGSVVRVNGTSRSTSFVNAGQLTAQVTAADIQTAGVASITVFNGAPGGGSSSAIDLAINNPVPAISTLSPSNLVAGDAAFALTVNGSNFVAGSVVHWNGDSRSTTFLNANQLTAQISAADIQAVGTATVTVVNPTPGGGTSDGATFSILASNSVPLISQLSPASATAGDSAFTLTVDGSNFISTSVVKWNGAARTTNFVNAGQLTADITAADISAGGIFHVSVSTPPPGGGDSNVIDFSVIAANGVPSISSLSPASATAGGAAFTLTVSGSNFVNGSVVRWDGSDRPTSFSSDSQLQAQIAAADIQSVGSHSITVFNPAPGGGGSNAVTFAVNDTGPEPVVLRFSSPNYQFSEATNGLEITVTRTGDTSAAVNVDFTTDDTTAFIPCGDPSGGANQRCDFATEGGTLTFAPGETSKSIMLLNTDDAYVEGNETFTVTLTNAAPTTSSLSSAVTIGTPAQATVTILDNDTVPPISNPIDEAHYFVNQHYMDFLARLPDADGLGYWTNEIAACGSDAACIHSRRIGVSAAFFVESEFQETGYTVYRLYKAAYGVKPTYQQFMPDRSQLVGGPQLHASTMNFANRFTSRAGFKASYPDAMTAAEFVNKLFDSAELMNSTSERQQQTDALTNGAKTRADVIMDVIEMPEFKQREYNSAFVLMEYFGYLRRDPDQGGFDFWLNVLNNREPNNYRSMVCAFITSSEYQQRFSSVTTRSNQDCGR